MPKVLLYRLWNLEPHLSPEKRSWMLPQIASHLKSAAVTLPEENTDRSSGPWAGFKSSWVPKTLRCSPCFEQVYICTVWSADISTFSSSMRWGVKPPGPLRAARGKCRQAKCLPIFNENAPPDHAWALPCSVSWYMPKSGQAACCNSPSMDPAECSHTGSCDSWLQAQGEGDRGINISMFLEFLFILCAIVTLRLQAAKAMDQQLLSSCKVNNRNERSPIQILEPEGSLIHLISRYAGCDQCHSNYLSHSNELDAQIFMLLCCYLYSTSYWKI